MRDIQSIQQIAAIGAEGVMKMSQDTATWFLSNCNPRDFGGRKSAWSPSRITSPVGFRSYFNAMNMPDMKIEPGMENGKVVFESAHESVTADVGVNCRSYVYEPGVFGEYDCRATGTAKTFTYAFTPFSYSEIASIPELGANSRSYTIYPAPPMWLVLSLAIGASALAGWLLTLL